MKLTTITHTQLESTLRTNGVHKGLAELCTITGDSLTLVMSLLNSVVLATSRKGKNSLLEALPKHIRTYLDEVLNLLTDNTDKLSLLTCANAPQYTSFMVSVSKHYKSCLYLHTDDVFEARDIDVTKLTDAEIAKEIYQYLMDIDDEDDEDTTDEHGCNVNYLTSEYNAWLNDDVRYITIGDPANPRVNSDGFVGRVRLVRFEQHGDGDDVWCFDRFYGNFNTTIPTLVNYAQSKGMTIGITPALAYKISHESAHGWRIADYKRLFVSGTNLGEPTVLDVYRKDVYLDSLYNEQRAIIATGNLINTVPTYNKPQEGVYVVGEASIKYDPNKNNEPRRFIGHLSHCDSNGNVGNPHTNIERVNCTNTILGNRLTIDVNKRQYSVKPIESESSGLCWLNYSVLWVIANGYEFTIDFDLCRVVMMHTKGDSNITVFDKYNGIMLKSNLRWSAVRRLFARYARTVLEEYVDVRSLSILPKKPAYYEGI